MKVLSNRLQYVKYVQTPNISRGRTITPSYIVIHYTGGPSLDRAVRTFSSKARKVSAHIVIGRDGEVVQMASFRARCWHAGSSSWEGLDGLNSHSIGIELVNSGPLKVNEAGEYKTWYGKTVPLTEVEMVEGKPWHAYTEEQMNALEEVCFALFSKYGSLEDVIGHSDCSPDRKIDPGPAFNMESFKSKFGGREDYDETETYTSPMIPGFVSFNPYRKDGNRT